VAPRTVNHLGQLPSVTISFNLKPQAAIGPVILEIERLARETLPAGFHAVFQGTAQAFQASLASMGFLLIITLLVIYMILGVLYESFLHPLTILTALPLAGFGALAALKLLGRRGRGAPVPGGGGGGRAAVLPAPDPVRDPGLLPLRGPVLPLAGAAAPNRGRGGGLILPGGG
jgi:hypothetical protein